MRFLFTIVALSSMLLANTLSQVAPTFSEVEKELLLQEFSKPLKASKEYTPKKGWNVFTAPKGGVDVPTTFKDVSTIKFVVTYDLQSKKWAIYSPNKNYHNDEILFLKYLEPDVTFFVLAKEDTKLNLRDTTLNESCKEMAQNPNYKTLMDSGIDRAPTQNSDKTMSIQSRYYSNHEKGFYTDTRVMLIYPKTNSKTKATYKYGPATPKVAFKFSKEYEGKKFYIYDYKAKKCFEGVFPSLRIPPFPVLKKI